MAKMNTKKDTNPNMIKIWVSLFMYCQKKMDPCLATMPGNPVSIKKVNKALFFDMSIFSSDKQTLLSVFRQFVSIFL